jgi:hypothetical protein
VHFSLTSPTKTTKTEVFHGKDKSHNSLWLFLHIYAMIFMYVHFSHFDRRHANFDISGTNKEHVKKSHKKQKRA